MRRVLHLIAELFITEQSCPLPNLLLPIDHGLSLHFFLIPDQLLLSHRTNGSPFVVADSWWNVDSPNYRFLDELRLTK